MAANKIFVVPAHAGISFPKPGSNGRPKHDRMVRLDGEYVPAVGIYLRGVRSGDLLKFESREAYLETLESAELTPVEAKPVQEPTPEPKPVKATKAKKKE